MKTKDKISKKTKINTNAKNAKVKRITKKEEKKLKEQKEIKETKSFLAKVKKNNPKLFKENKELSNFSEFYDLPLKYDETVVRLISQTPTKLFVYWDVSDKDKLEFEEKFNKSFWNNTYPLLLVENKDTTETFEVPVNDFANSWYIDIKDKASNYKISLIRRFKNKENVSNENQDIFICSSNEFVSSDKHINYANNEYLRFKNLGNNEEFLVKLDKAQIKKTAHILNIDENKFEEFLENRNQSFLSGSSQMEFL